MWCWRISSSSSKRKVNAQPILSAVFSALPMVRGSTSGARVSPSSKTTSCFSLSRLSSRSGPLAWPGLLGDAGCESLAARDANARRLPEALTPAFFRSATALDDAGDAMLFRSSLASSSSSLALAGVLSTPEEPSSSSGQNWPLAMGVGVRCIAGAGARDAPASGWICTPMSRSWPNFDGICTLAPWRNLRLVRQLRQALAADRQRAPVALATSGSPGTHHPSDAQERLVHQRAAALEADGKRRSHVRGYDAALGHPRALLPRLLEHIRVRVTARGFFVAHADAGDKRDFSSAAGAPDRRFHRPQVRRVVGAQDEEYLLVRAGRLRELCALLVLQKRGRCQAQSRHLRHWIRQDAQEISCDGVACELVELVRPKAEESPAWFSRRVDRGC
eukprot:scaffold2848_cov218-Pinguiococcus_pyrenoidosus.AAC.6